MVSCAGVAADGKRAFISGGVTGFEETRKELYLADIWMFNASNCSWMQVRPRTQPIALDRL